RTGAPRAEGGGLALSSEAQDFVEGERGLQVEAIAGGQHGEAAAPPVPQVEVGGDAGEGVRIGGGLGDAGAAAAQRFRNAVAGRVVERSAADEDRALGEGPA